MSMQPDSPWTVAGAFVGRRTLMKYAAAALGGALVSACAGSNGTSVGAAATAGVINKVLVGSWRILPWEGVEGPPRSTDNYGVTSVFDIPRVSPPTPSAGDKNVKPWPFQAAITESSFTVGTASAVRLTGAETNHFSGTWRFQDTGIVIALDDTTVKAIGIDTQYDNRTVPTAGLPRTVDDGSSGRFQWNYRKEEPDYVSYSVKRGMVHLFFPVHEDEGMNYLAVRA